jgi:hypothetical protein
MRYRIESAKPTEGAPPKDRSEYCGKLTLKATSEKDEVILATIANALAYKNDRDFLVWLVERLKARGFE